ncbi:MAG: cytochrome c4 [Methylobacteriaceae bacterium]|nr:cytochrome c4 [Methylobacteriaceae bacterium]
MHKTDGRAQPGHYVLCFQSWALPMNAAWRLPCSVAAGALCCGLGTAALAQNDDAKAKFEPCVACHNADGISTTENIPSLAGQTDRYVQWQLVYFRSGTRKSEIMNPIAEPLSNEDIRDLGTYVAKLPAAAPVAPSHADLVEKGRALAAQNRCSACHGEKLQGNGAAARLSGQREDYLLKALKDFKAGKRVGGGMAAMADVVYPLSPDDLPALAAYAASAR